MHSLDMDKKAVLFVEVSDSLKAALAALAAENERSLSAEVRFLLARELLHREMEIQGQVRIG
jgi:plasmid stability protein